MDGWNKTFLLGFGNISGAMAVSFREVFGQILSDLSPPGTVTPKIGGEQVLGGSSQLVSG